MKKMTLATLFLTACYRSESDFSQLQDVVVAPGEMAGDLPEVEPFDDDLSIDRASLFGTWFDVDLHVEGPYGWAMVGGDVDLADHVDVDSGTATIAYGDAIELTDDDLWSWVGCAGPESGWADFDEEPKAVRLTFEDPADLGYDVGDDYVGVVVDTDFGHGDQVRAATLVRRY